MQKLTRDAVQGVLFSPEGAGFPSDGAVLPIAVAYKVQEGIIKQTQPRPNLRRIRQSFGQRLLELVGLTDDGNRDPSLL